VKDETRDRKNRRVADMALETIPALIEYIDQLETELENTRGIT